MRVIFLGCTKFSEEILVNLLKIDKIDIVAIFSIPEHFSISYSSEPVKNTNYSDLSVYASRIAADYFLIDSVKGSRIIDYKERIKEYDADVILVMGWYFMLPKSIRELAKNGAWGIHASLLPKYAGGAPLVWAIIEGENETGVTLFRLDDGVDDGDIIKQKTISIEPCDTIREVYVKAIDASNDILTEILSTNEFTFTPQNKSDIQIYPQRSPKDGEIDWNQEPERIRNFIRAQTRPYPGAWTIINNKKVTIWDASLEGLSNKK